jgi:hypothetical protein
MQVLQRVDECIQILLSNSYSKLATACQLYCGFYYWAHGDYDTANAVAL